WQDEERVLPGGWCKPAWVKVPEIPCDENWDADDSAPCAPENSNLQAQQQQKQQQWKHEESVLSGGWCKPAWVKIPEIPSDENWDQDDSSTYIPNIDNKDLLLSKAQKHFYKTCFQK